MLKQVAVILAVLLIGCKSNNGVMDVTPTPGSCELIDYTIATVCASLQDAYNYTSFPNLNNDDTLDTVIPLIGPFSNYINSGCSSFILELLCSFYIPPCIVAPTNTDLVFKLQPCRNICEDVYDNCIDLFIEENKEWPAQFNCSSFPDNLCFGPQPVEPVSSIIASSTPSISATTTQSLDQPTSTTAIRTPVMTPTLIIPTIPEGNAATCVSTCVHLIVSALLTTLYLFSM